MLPGVLETVFQVIGIWCVISFVFGGFYLYMSRDR